MYILIFILIIVYIAVTLGATAAVNSKLSGKRAEFWSRFLRTLMLFALIVTIFWTAYSTSLAGTLADQWSTFLGVLYLLGLLYLCASFFAEYYIQYHKQKDDPAALVQIMKRGLETILCAIFFSAMGIVHLTFF